MSIFEAATSEAESPMDFGQEETTPAEEVLVEDTDNQQTDPETSEEPEDDSSPESGQEEDDADYVPKQTYNELRKGFTQKAQEAAELKRQLEAMRQPQQPPTPGQGPARDPQNMAEFQQVLSQQVAQMREEGYHEAFIDAKVEAATANFRTAMIERRLEAQENQKSTDRINQDIDALRGDFPDIGTDDGMYMLVNKVQEIANELGTPQIVQRPSKRILQMAAQEIWGDSKAKLYESAKAKGKQEALDNIKAKQGVNTTISKKPNEQPKSLEEQMADSIMTAGRSGGIFGY